MNDTNDGRALPEHSQARRANGANSVRSGRLSAISRDLLGVYLADHLAGAKLGAQRTQRMATAFADSPFHDRLSELSEQIRSERKFLQELIHDFDMRQHTYRQAIAWLGEHVGRLKGNGRVVSRSPSTLVLETELMRSAVIGKLGVWQTLRSNAEELGLEQRVFTDLEERVAQQVRVLDEVHEFARERAFRRDRETFTSRG